eukprot:2986382-Pyramimonas_sp.AAC.1
MDPAADESSCLLAPVLKIKLRSKMVGGSPLAVSRLAANYTTSIAPVLLICGPVQDDGHMAPARRACGARAPISASPIDVFNIPAWL